MSTIQRQQGPGTYNFCTHYQDGGLKSFQLRFRYKKTKAPLDFQDAVLVKMQIRDSMDRVAFEFSTKASAEYKITLLEDGVIRFPTINSWKLKPGVYKYDLVGVWSDGFERPYMRGTWSITKNVTKI